MNESMPVKKPSLFTLLLLMPFASISAVLFTPALPEIAQLLSISDGAVQASMTLFLLGYALGNLPYGPLAKRYGRKGAIYIGATIAIFGSLLTLYGGKHQLFSLFLAGRFLSALGSSVGMKISFTLIADAFEPVEATKKLSLATLAFAIAPGLSVATGGFLTTRFGWESCFYALIAYSCLIGILSFLLAETAPHLDKEALQYKKIVSGYLKNFTNKKFIGAALIMGSVTSVIYLFTTLAPFIGIKRFGLSPEEYGFLNSIPPMGLIGGSFASYWLSTRQRKVTVIQLGGSIAALSSGVMLLLFALGKANYWTLFLPMPFVYLGTSLVYNQASSLALEQVEDKSNGSAVMSFTSMMIAALSVCFASFLSSSKPFVMPLLFLILTAILLFLLRHLENAE